MRTLILLTKEDIKTYKMGSHFEISINETMGINFTPEAIEELVKDYLESKNNNGYDNVPLTDTSDTIIL